MNRVLFSGNLLGKQGKEAGWKMLGNPSKAKAADPGSADLGVVVVK